MQILIAEGEFAEQEQPSAALLYELASAAVADIDNTAEPGPRQMLEAAALFVRCARAMRRG